MGPTVPKPIVVQFLNRSHTDEINYIYSLILIRCLSCVVFRCEGRFILMDVAMSRWMGGGQPAALLIETDADTGKMTRIYAKLPMHEGAAGKEMDFHIGPPLSAEKAAARDEL